MQRSLFLLRRGGAHHPIFVRNVLMRHSSPRSLVLMRHQQRNFGIWSNIRSQLSEDQSSKLDESVKDLKESTDKMKKQAQEAYEKAAQSKVAESVSSATKRTVDETKKAAERLAAEAKKAGETVKPLAEKASEQAGSAAKKSAETFTKTADSAKEGLEGASSRAKTAFEKTATSSVGKSVQGGIKWLRDKMPTSSSSSTSSEDASSSSSKVAQTTDFMRRTYKETGRIINEDILGRKSYARHGKLYGTGAQSSAKVATSDTDADSIDKSTASPDPSATDAGADADAGTDADADPSSSAASSHSPDIEVDTTTTTIFEVEQEKTQWEKLRDQASKTKAYGKYVGYKRQFDRYAAKNPFFKKLAETRTAISDKYEDLQEEYETTQNPVVWKVRDMSDRIFADTDTAAALSKVQQFDEQFDIVDLMNEMQAHILPAIVDAQLRCDMDFIKQTCVDNAYKGLFAYCKQREAQTEKFEYQIVDFTDAEFIGAVIHNKKPVLNLSIFVQTMETKTKQQVAGQPAPIPEHQMNNTFYKFSVTHDPTDPVFGWKFVDITMQLQQYITA